MFLINSINILSSVKRIRGYFRIILINVLILVVPIIAIIVTDIYFTYDRLDYLTKRFRCDSKLTNYDYCPSITHLRYMALADKWFPIVNYIDADRKSTYKEKPKFQSNGKRIFLIGDSFVQAEELRIEDRFEHLLRKEGYEVYAFGYSSWNSKQFNAIVKSLDLKEGDEVFVFSMGNDYTPSYGSSTIKTTLNVAKDREAIPETRTLFKRIEDSSLIFNIYYRAKTMLDKYLIDKKDEGDESKAVTFSHTSKNWKDCSTLPEKSQVASSSVHDYLVLSKHESCWDQNIRDSVDLNVKLLKEAELITKSQGAYFNVALVSAGWAFPNQNTIGRKHKLYNIPEDITVSQVGLVDKLKDVGFNVIDLENLLQPHILEGTDSLYFPVDGHFTARTHQIIGDFLVEFLEPNVR